MIIANVVHYYIGDIKDCIDIIHFLNEMNYIITQVNALKLIFLLYSNIVLSNYNFTRFI